MTLSLEGRPTKAKEAPSPHRVRLDLLDTNPIFQCLEVKFMLDCQKINLLTYFLTTNKKKILSTCRTKHPFLMMDH